MSVRSRASARLQMTALFGSPALWPHLSSWSNPLRLVSFARSLHARYSPGSQHLDEMLLGCASLLTSFQPGENAILFEQ